MSFYKLEQIRSTFTDFFKKNGHEHVASSSLLPHNDPSLMFVNSGMVQFKDIFTGNEVRDYSRATSSQKCIRAGGKHNDLDNVGYTARHHTFFEMLGNFSFGDYFKEEAIKYAWDLLTKDFGLDKNKLYFTVYHDDAEAASWWKKISSCSDDRIIPISTSDNFWSMGDTGPCGPCSEIFYDHGDKIPGGLPGTPEEDGDRYIEIWNIVFMQYEQIDKDTRIPLPKKSVDTGMGLERIAAVIQGVHDNYDVDMFRDLIGNAESLFKVKAEGEQMFSYRVIADHLRSMSFLMADGVMPSNEGRGYVLRRIMRRAMRHAHQLGAREPILHRMLPKLVDHFGHAFPELQRAEEFVSSLIYQEEERFKMTLGRGLKVLEEETDDIAEGGMLKGDVAFKLYDTYGFPVDLTEDILKKQSIQVDMKGFDEAMLEQKERARKAWVGSGESKTDKIWIDLLAQIGATEFLGYSHDSMQGKVLALVQDGRLVDEATSSVNLSEGGVSEGGVSGKQNSQSSDKDSEGSNTGNEGEFILVLNQTPFYAESGGQMGDIGEISSAGCDIQVIDTIKFAGKIHGHKCKIISGTIKTDDIVQASINTKNRNDLRIHHSATHILHAVLRDVIGGHVTQKGSLVAADKLRFDFSHTKGLTKDEIKIIERKVNDVITNNSKVNTQLLSLEEATEAGAMALFGEKYDSEVRVVSMGGGIDKISAKDDKEDSTGQNPAYSFELCGGTHVDRTGDIGAFKIVSESAIAAGVRRIEAVCAEHAFDYFAGVEGNLEAILSLLRTNKAEAISKLTSLIEEKKTLEKKLNKLNAEKLKFSDGQIAEAKKISNKSDGSELGSARLFYKKIDDVDIKSMRSAAEDLIKKHDDLVVVLASIVNDKIAITIACSEKIRASYNAGNIAKEISALMGGSGGGRDSVAQAGAALSDESRKIFDNLEQKLMEL